MNLFKLSATLCVVLGTLFVAQAQQAPVVGQGHYNDSDFGKFYVRVGLSFPSNDLITQLNDGDFDGTYSSKTGINAEIGRYFFFHSEPIADLLKVGLDASFFSFGYNPMSWTDAGDPDFADDTDLTSMAVKLGPVISFNPLEDFYADAFVKMAPTLLTSMSGMIGLQEELLFGLKTDVGINLRYKKLTLTAGYESGSFKNVFDSGEYNEDTGQLVEHTSEKKLPMGMFQLKLGLQFY